MPYEFNSNVHRTMRRVAMVMTLIAFASSVGYVMALMQVPARVTISLWLPRILSL